MRPQMRVNPLVEQISAAILVAGQTLRAENCVSTASWDPATMATMARQVNAAHEANETTVSAANCKTVVTPNVHWTDAGVTGGPAQEGTPVWMTQPCHDDAGNRNHRSAFVPVQFYRC